MTTVALIDDRTDFAEQLADLFQLNEAKAEFISRQPFASIDETVEWIIDSNIHALIVDQKLTEKAIGDSDEHANYDGAALGSAVRQRLARLPIMLVSGFLDEYNTSERVSRIYGCFNYVERKDVIATDPSQFISFVVTNAVQFSSSAKAAFRELSQLAAKVAKGKADQSDRERLLELQAEIHLTYIPQDILSREEKLSQVEKTVSEIREERLALEEELRKLKNEGDNQ